MKNKMNMWQVDVRNEETNEMVKVIVPAKTNEQATKIASKLYPWGYDMSYKWEGTGPAYDSSGNRLTVEIGI